ncbi:MAG: ATP synthase F1 subunit delta [Candidatus Acetothermia bacterium]
MKSTEVADKYAEALYEIGKEEGRLDEFVEELDALTEIVTANETFLHFLTHPLVPDGDKVRLIDRVFGSDLSGDIRNFLRVLVSRDREGYIDLIQERFHKLRREKEDILEVEVKVPAGFSREGLSEKIEERLEERTGRTVQVTSLTEEEGLIGGAKLSIGDKVIDGSVKGQLEDLREFVLEGGNDGRN